jgi:hypothetical protein
VTIVAAAQVAASADQLALPEPVAQLVRSVAALPEPGVADGVAERACELWIGVHCVPHGAEPPPEPSSPADGMLVWHVALGAGAPPPDARRRLLALWCRCYQWDVALERRRVQPTAGLSTDGSEPPR